MNNFVILKKNEVKINKIVYKLFLGAFFFLLLDYIVVIMSNGKLIIDTPKIILYLQSILALIPFLYYKFSPQKDKFRYIAITIAHIMSFCMYSISGIYAVYIFVIPSAIACLYSDHKFVKINFGVDMILMILAQLCYLHFYPNDIIKFDLKTSLVIILYYFLQLLLIGWIFSLNTKKAYNLLKKSEELNEKLNGNISSLVNRSNTLSKELSSSVNILYSNMKQSTLAVDEITSSIKDLSINSEKFIDSENCIELSIKEIVEYIKNTNIKIKSMVEDTTYMANISTSNKNNLTNSVEEVLKTKEITDKCKKAVNLLVEESNEIEKSLVTIDDISKKTNILSLNASIEAVKAGDTGKGFIVVAEEIKKLANQSKQSCDYIKHILQKISFDITTVEEFIDTADETVRNEVNSVKNSTENFDKMFNLQNKLINDLEENSANMELLLTKGYTIKQISEKLNLMNDTNHKNLTEIFSIMINLNKTFNDIYSHVGKINEKSKELVK